MNVKWVVFVQDGEGYAKGVSLNITALSSKSIDWLLELPNQIYCRKVREEPLQKTDADEPPSLSGEHTQKRTV